MKQEEKKRPNWEMMDPKPPVIQSGHLENRRQNRASSCKGPGEE